MYAQHLVSVFEVAASVLKNHRRNVRKGEAGQAPFVKRLFMKPVNQAYKLDCASGVVDLPIRAGCHVELRLVLSEYHRRFLDDPSLSRLPDALPGQSSDRLQEDGAATICA